MSDHVIQTVGFRFFVAAVLVLMSALVCGIVAVGVCRRYAFSRGGVAMWGIIGFLFGPAGLLLQWCMLAFPAREPCHSCGKLRVVSRVTCEHCDSTISAPALDGTEIFA